MDGLKYHPNMARPHLYLWPKRRTNSTMHNRNEANKKITVFIAHKNVLTISTLRLLLL